MNKIKDVLINRAVIALVSAAATFIAASYPKAFEIACDTIPPVL